LVAKLGFNDNQLQERNSHIQKLQDELADVYEDLKKSEIKAI